MKIRIIEVAINGDIYKKIIPLDFKGDPRWGGIPISKNGKVIDYTRGDRRVLVDYTEKFNKMGVGEVSPEVFANMVIMLAFTQEAEKYEI